MYLCTYIYRLWMRVRVHSISFISKSRSYRIFLHHLVYWYHWLGRGALDPQFVCTTETKKRMKKKTQTYTPARISGIRRLVSMRNRTVRADQGRILLAGQEKWYLIRREGSHARPLGNVDSWICNQAGLEWTKIFTKSIPNPASIPPPSPSGRRKITEIQSS